jgi:hypothetical protein
MVKETIMPQDRSSGAEGDRYGREFGKRIAAALGAKPLTTGSNECLLNGDRIVIKCAHEGTKSVGVSYKMRERIKAVLGAFEEANGSYRVLRLPVERCASVSTPTRSRGASSGKVGIIQRSVFETEGTLVKIVRL